MNLPLPIRAKITVRKAILYGWLLVNLPVLLLIFGVPAVFLGPAIQNILPMGLMLASFPVAFVAAWLWWSWTIPRWRLWAMLRTDNLYRLQLQAVRAQLVWPSGSIYENTEFKSPLHVLEEKHIEIHFYFDKFRYYLDYLDAIGRPFHGLDDTRRDTDAFRETLYLHEKDPLFRVDLKLSVDRLRFNLKTIRHAVQNEQWPLLIDELVKMLDKYQAMLKQQM